MAFALIKTRARIRIQREAQAMGRLVSHQHIVTVFDLGEHEGQPYMVTEQMGRGDVEGIIDNATDNWIALEQAAGIAEQACPRPGNCPPGPEA